jgi:hypothetical protein
LDLSDIVCRSCVAGHEIDKLDEVRSQRLHEGISSEVDFKTGRLLDISLIFVDIGIKKN